MKDKNKERFTDFSITVSWTGISEEEHDLNDQELFKKSISAYIEFFHSIPPIGMLIENGSCDDGRIDEVTFDGINKNIHFYLIF